MSIHEILRKLKYLLTAPITDNEPYTAWRNQEGSEHKDKLFFYYSNIVRILKGNVRFSDESLGVKDRRIPTLLKLLETEEYFRVLKIWIDDNNILPLTQLLQKNKKLTDFLIDNISVLVPVALDWYRYRLKYLVDHSIKQATALRREHELKTPNPKNQYGALITLISFLEDEVLKPRNLTPAEIQEISRLKKSNPHEMPAEHVEKLFTSIYINEAMLSGVDFSRLFPVLRLIPDTEHYTLMARLYSQLFSLTKTPQSKAIFLLVFQDELSKFNFNDVTIANYVYLKSALQDHFSLLGLPLLDEDEAGRQWVNNYFTKLCEIFRQFSLQDYQQIQQKLSYIEASEIHTKITAFFTSLCRTPFKNDTFQTLKKEVEEFLLVFLRFKPEYPVIPATPPVPGSTSTPSSQDLPAGNDVNDEPSQITSDEEAADDEPASMEEDVPFSLQRAIPAAASAAAVRRVYSVSDMSATFLGGRGSEAKRRGEETDRSVSESPHDDKRSRGNPEDAKTAPQLRRF